MLYLYKGSSAFSDIYAQARKPHNWYAPQADILPRVTNHQPILQLVNLCTTLQKKEWLHKLCSSWPGDVHIILWKVHKPVCFVLSFVGPLMQSLKQKAARKASLQSILPLCNFVRLTFENACPNLMCCRQFFFNCVLWLTCQLHTTPSKEYNYVSSASAVQKSLTEALSHLLQIVTYLISEERNRIQR